MTDPAKEQLNEVEQRDRVPGHVPGSGRDELAAAEAKAESLQESSHKLAEAVYAQATAQAQQSAGGNGASSADEEVVEEGEYEDVTND